MVVISTAQLPSAENTIEKRIIRIANLIRERACVETPVKTKQPKREYIKRMKIKSELQIIKNRREEWERNNQAWFVGGHESDEFVGADEGELI